jgi:hypothetical protein
MFQRANQLLVIGFAAVLSAYPASAARAGANQDSINLIGSLDLPHGKIQQIQIVNQEGRSLLYLGDTSQRAATVIDVSDPTHPRVAREMAIPGGLVTLKALGTDSVLVSDRALSDQNHAESLSIVSFKNHDNGTVKCTFANVTALSRDDYRGLIFLVDNEGLKILGAEDSPELQAEREFTSMLDAR